MEAFAAYEFPQSGFPRLGNIPNKMQRHGCGMAGIPKGKERLCLLGYLDVSSAPPDNGISRLNGATSNIVPFNGRLNPATPVFR